MTAASDGAPVTLRIARAITIAKTVLASVVTMIALLFAITSKHSDDVARRAGNPQEFEGLGAGIGASYAVVFGVIALAFGAASIGLCRSRTWGLVTAGITEVVLLLAAGGLTSAGAPPSYWLPVIVPSAVVLASVASPKCRAWCRARTLA